RKLTAVKPGQLAIISPKMRDSKKGGVLTFKLEEVELGTNRWGNPVTSMAVVEAADRVQSTGNAFDAVDEGDEAPASDDELTADQNRQAEE
ncbi:hypothetical protein, partial [Enterococcus faecalis]|uniref:hypothetical protein n=1 Tax=Enterococcus faecalis TaxID=1351 RepID=UPI003D6A750E